jgi:hypothetical protein
MRIRKSQGKFLPKKSKHHRLKRSVVMKKTTNRREHHLLYDRWINGDCCFICSARVGEWVDCWRSNDNEHDNPVKSWKYKYKKEKQWIQKPNSVSGSRLLKKYS